jgi:DNA-binding NarL/FixJ family response regulator
MQCPELSPLQAAVALGLWAGLADKEIAGWLDRSYWTVRSHEREVRRRLRRHGVQRRSDVVRVVERALSAPGGPPGARSE